MQKEKAAMNTATFHSEQTLPSGASVKLTIEVSLQAVGNDRSSDIDNAIKKALNSIEEHSKKWAVIDWL